ncbi:nucleotidyltransferase substrate binding protein [Nitrosomonas sp. H1_AOB3]|uniref:nucleotidyltransferase substrate binding protein n=1 Tax=Nitrosomonas sp. H1_AOB3 TaxID=2741553 RepID=UPI00338F1CE5
MKDYFEYQGHYGLTSSRDTIREAFKHGLIVNGESWIDTIKSRNRSTHTYDDATSQQLEYCAFKYVHTLNSGSNFCIHILRRAAVCCRWFSTKHRMIVPWPLSKGP